MRILTTSSEQQAYLRLLRQRAQGVNPEVVQTVTEILANIAEKGDEALLKYAQQFDHVDQIVRLKREDIEKLAAKGDQTLAQALKQAAKNIRRYHQEEKPSGFLLTDEHEAFLGRLVRPLKRVGIYIPGGRAAYPSSVLMNAIPAKIAGVPEVVMVTPPGKDGLPRPEVLLAAAIAEVDEMILVGGAHAVGALAYGTESIPAVDKITGPGNEYVATAKRLVYGQVDIDMIAGPSEILIIADDSADPNWLAADLLSQAEHDPNAGCVLVTVDPGLAQKTRKAVFEQLKQAPRQEIMQAAIENYGAILLMPNEEAAFEIANAIAPEHLELVLREPLHHLHRVENAGSIFLGGYTPEAVGDYVAGCNHVLPTGGTARFRGPLGVEDFVKYTAFSSYSQKALGAMASTITTIAEAEGLYAHGASVQVRGVENENQP